MTSGKFSIFLTSKGSLATASAYCAPPSRFSLEAPRPRDTTQVTGRKEKAPEVPGRAVGSLDYLGHLANRGVAQLNFRQLQYFIVGRSSGRIAIGLTRPLLALDDRPCFWLSCPCHPSGSFKTFVSGLLFRSFYCLC